MLIRLAVQLGIAVDQMGVKTAYLNVPIDYELYI